MKKKKKVKCPNCENPSPHMAVFVGDVPDPFCSICKEPLLIDELRPKKKDYGNYPSDDIADL